jgi:uncharacterized protein YndB with AHSA1/START domain
MAETRSGAETVDLEVRVKASPETLWGFLTDPQKMTRWKGRTAEIDPRPGGVHRVEISDQVKAVGEYVEVEPHSRILLTWGWEGHPEVPSGSTRVEVTLEPDGEETIIRLRHADLPENERAIHADGWRHYLDRLSIAAAGGDPGPDPNESAQPGK